MAAPAVDTVLFKILLLRIIAPVQFQHAIPPPASGEEKLIELQVLSMITQFSTTELEKYKKIPPPHSAIFSFTINEKVWDWHGRSTQLHRNKYCQNQDDGNFLFRPAM